MPVATATEAEFFERARALAGNTLGSIAAEQGSVPPADLTRAKGWAGQLLERALGASAASRAEPDFQHLGVELKSLPVDARGRPRESTFVCTIPLSEIGEVEWERSRVRRKLRRVLWLPIEAERRLLPAQRHVGEPLLWSPSAEEESALRFDWEELSGLIGRGAVEAITGHLGNGCKCGQKPRTAAPGGALWTLTVRDLPHCLGDSTCERRSLRVCSPRNYALGRP